MAAEKDKKTLSSTNGKSEKSVFSRFMRFLAYINYKFCFNIKSLFKLCISHTKLHKKICRQNVFLTAIA